MYEVAEKEINQRFNQTIHIIKMYSIFTFWISKI